MRWILNLFVNLELFQLRSVKHKCSGHFSFLHGLIAKDELRAEEVEIRGQEAFLLTVPSLPGCWFVPVKAVFSLEKLWAFSPGIHQRAGFRSTDHHPSYAQTYSKHRFQAHRRKHLHWQPLKGLWLLWLKNKYISKIGRCLSLWEESFKKLKGKSELDKWRNKARGALGFLPRSHRFLIRKFKPRFHQPGSESSG